ncbi:uncharacterized protein LOC107435240 [Ziziphus jujuba]|uniref:Uncharacterized protein LOC107435240 n=2 Tax=Ziziphus jujuba TaxID=326968 RepID=A0A6P4ATE6_ZIZJJ|nr:uncharacterized protein LOC107435240 [Ziziphus jujuba]KAH7516788.1 hypothetical protein FEM48_Zijuj10G0171900 [Ziziphus jujuba var. spinosa]
MAPPSLLGPPELRKPVTKPDSDSLVDHLVSNFNKTSPDPIPEQSPTLCQTENSAPTFLSSGSPCLDLFFHVVPNTPTYSLPNRLKSAWELDPLTTLKLICNLRGVRGTGKNDKEGFYTAALWLHHNHPKTLASNVASFADFGFFKDLPEILYRLLEGDEVRRTQKEEWLLIKGSGSRSRSRDSKDGPFGMRGRPLGGMRVGLSSRRSSRASVSSKNTTKRGPKYKVVHTLPREIRVQRAEERSMREKEMAKELRTQKRIAMAKKVVEKYESDPNFKFLYEKISHHFADSLKADIEFLNSKEYRKISLAAKWCPSIDSSFDRSTLLCESIARKVFPRDSYPEYQGIEEAHYAYRVRDRLRKEILVPLRKALQLPEVYIGANRWNFIPYNRVSSVAMKLYKTKFFKHDKKPFPRKSKHKHESVASSEPVKLHKHKTFSKYLEDVRDGKSKIAAGALLPQEIIASLWDGDGGDVAELQWKRMVDDLLNKGKLKNCLAVSDVSRSMNGIPMEVSVALGLLVSELSEDPWKGKIITFCENPRFHVIQGEDLRSKIEFVRAMEWGGHPNLQKVFDLILQVAVNANLNAEQMIKRVFVFSDMEFHQVSPTRWETDYEGIRRKFGKKGYEDVVPEIVFWNLRDSRSTPVPRKQEGVALVSGISKNLMNLFLDGTGEMNPESVMKLAISGEEYQKLLVVD